MKDKNREYQTSERFTRGVQQNQQIFNKITTFKPYSILNGKTLCVKLLKNNLNGSPRR